MAIYEALLALWLALSITLTVVGIGVLMVPGSLDLVRSEARRQRRLALSYSGVFVVEQYLALPDAGDGFGASWSRVYAMLGDRATRQDLLWHLVNPFVGPLMTFVPLLAIVHGIWGIVLLWLWEPVVRHWDNSWYLFVPLSGQRTAVLSAVLGVLSIALGLYLARPLVRLHGRWVATFLGHVSHADLQDRVQHLAESRSDAMEMQSQEIRRIERDLHDGAQARLVAMGMTLAAAENLVDENPDAARLLLQEAKQSSADALRELRDLVRGIHPPVLADRGLVDAIRARALQSPLRVEVRSAVQGRALPPLESAVYFAVSELLTNAAKHSGAGQVVIDIANDEGTLRVSVQDDGRGGAGVSQGTGLRGIERRLAAFDGYLLVHSPQGGPTSISVVVPCQMNHLSATV